MQKSLRNFIFHYAKTGDFGILNISKWIKIPKRKVLHQIKKGRYSIRNLISQFGWKRKKNVTMSLFLSQLEYEKGEK